MIGVNFQPGQNGNGYDPRGNGAPSAGNGVQEAIKVLSLRLPKVVGAQGVAPQGLLESMGGGGSRVDSVVNQVLSRMFPTGGGQMPPMQMASFGTMPEAPGNAPSFSGSAQPAYGGLKQPAPIDRAYSSPRVIVDSPFGHGDLVMGLDGRPKTSPFGAGPFESLPGADFQQQPATIAPLPQWSYGGGGQEPDNPYAI